MQPWHRRMLREAGMSRNQSTCGLCGEAPSDTRRVITGRIAGICQNCVRLSNTIFDQGDRFTFDVAEAKTLWAALQSLAQFEHEDEMGAILKNNAGRLRKDRVVNLVDRLRDLGSAVFVGSGLGFQKDESPQFEGIEFNVHRMMDGFVRIYARIKASQPEDFSVTGQEAQRRYACWILFTAMGMVPRIRPIVEEALQELGLLP
jgi:ClpX C4-type zinc finger protein